MADAGEEREKMIESLSELRARREVEDFFQENLFEPIAYVRSLWTKYTASLALPLTRDELSDITALEELLERFQKSAPVTLSKTKKFEVQEIHQRVLRMQAEEYDKAIDREDAVGMEMEGRSTGENRAALIAEIKRRMADLQVTMEKLANVNGDWSESVRQLNGKCSKVKKSLGKSCRTIASYKLRMQRLKAMKRKMLEQQYYELSPTTSTGSSQVNKRREQTQMQTVRPPMARPQMVQPPMARPQMVQPPMARPQMVQPPMVSASGVLTFETTDGPTNGLMPDQE